MVVDTWCVKKGIISIWNPGVLLTEADTREDTGQRGVKIFDNDIRYLMPGADYIDVNTSSLEFQLGLIYYPSVSFGITASSWQARLIERRSTETWWLCWSWNWWKWDMREAYLLYHAGLLLCKANNSGSAEDHVIKIGTDHWEYYFAIGQEYIMAWLRRWPPRHSWLFWWGTYEPFSALSLSKSWVIRRGKKWFRTKGHYLRAIHRWFSCNFVQFLHFLRGVRE